MIYKLSDFDDEIYMIANLYAVPGQFNDKVVPGRLIDVLTRIRTLIVQTQNGEPTN